MGGIDPYRPGCIQPLQTTYLQPPVLDQGHILRGTAQKPCRSMQEIRALADWFGGRGAQKAEETISNVLRSRPKTVVDLVQPERARLVTSSC